VTTAYARSQGIWFLDESGEDESKGCWRLRYCGNSWTAKRVNAILWAVSILTDILSGQRKA